MAALHPEYNSCEDECPVCLLKLQEARYLHCNHLFCLRCLDQIHTVPSTALRCPMCRQVTFLPDDGPRCLPGIKSDLNRERAASPSFDPKQGVNDAPDHSEPHPSTSNYDGVETMRLFLQDVYGKKNPIIINADAAVSDLKEKVQAITGLPVNDMRLISGGQELAHGKSLRSCNLPEDSVLQTSTKNAEGSVKILVENEHGEKISVFVPIDGRVSDVQAKVMEQLGIHPREQRLMFGDRELSDHQSLRSVGAIGTSVLRMEKVSRPTGFTLPRNRRPALPDIRFESTTSSRQPRDNPGRQIELIIKTLTGKVLHIFVDSEGITNDIKDAICHQEGIPADCQRLIFGGRQLEDGAPLHYYNICNCLTIDRPIHLVLRLPGAGPGVNVH